MAKQVRSLRVVMGDERSGRYVRTLKKEGYAFRHAGDGGTRRDERGAASSASRWRCGRSSISRPEADWDRPPDRPPPPFDQSLHIRGCAESEWPLSTRAGPGPGVDIVPNLRFATVELLTGPRLHYAEQGAADGEPIVFLHGWPDSWFSFSRVIALLPHGFMHSFWISVGLGTQSVPMVATVSLTSPLMPLHFSMPPPSTEPPSWGTHLEVSSPDTLLSLIPNESPAWY